LDSAPLPHNAPAPRLHLSLVLARGEFAAGSVT
jgi:hypothetical protein